jgi:hypothetical protein
VIILDSSLTWKEHFLYTSKKVAKTIGILSQARQFFNKKTLTQLYYSFAYPYLIYCNIIWGNATKTTIWPLFKLQKMAIRMITYTKRRESTQSEFKKLKIIRLPEIYNYSANIFMYKFKNNMLPTKFDNLFRLNNEFHTYNTTNSRNLRVPKTNTTLADNFIAKAGVKIWNTTIRYIDCNTTISIFKKKLIDYLIADYKSI